MHSNIFKDYIDNHGKLQVAQAELEKQQAVVDEIETAFNEEEVPVATIWQLIEETKKLDDLKSNHNELEHQQKRLLGYIDVFSKKHPNVKRISFRPDVDELFMPSFGNMQMEPAQWTDVLLDGANVTLEIVRANR